MRPPKDVPLMVRQPKDGTPKSSSVKVVGAPKTTKITSKATGKTYTVIAKYGEELPQAVYDEIDRLDRDLESEQRVNRAKEDAGQKELQAAGNQLGSPKMAERSAKAYREANSAGQALANLPKQLEPASKAVADVLKIFGAEAVSQMGGEFQGGPEVRRALAKAENDPSNPVAQAGAGIVRGAANFGVNMVNPVGYPQFIAQAATDPVGVAKGATIDQLNILFDTSKPISERTTAFGNLVTLGLAAKHGYATLKAKLPPGAVTLPREVILGLREKFTEKYGSVLGKVQLRKAVKDLTGSDIPKEMLELDLDNPPATTPAVTKTNIGKQVTRRRRAGTLPAKPKERVVGPQTLIEVVREQAMAGEPVAPSSVKQPKQETVVVPPETPIVAPETPAAAPEPSTPIPTPETPVTPPAQPLVKQKSAEGELFTEERMNPQNIQVREGFQYKNTEVVDKKNQVSGKLKDTEVYDQATGPLTVWEAKDGQRYVMNGHHRLELAKRTNTPDVAVKVFREVDGVSPEKARALGVLQNLRDGTGTALDAARVLQDLGLSPSDLGKRGINLKQGVGRDAVQLMSMDAATLDYVASRNIPEPVAAEVAAANLPTDKQMMILRRMADKDIQTRTEASLLVEAIKDQPLVVRDDGTGNLFGDVEMDFPFEEQAKITAAVMEQLQKTARSRKQVAKGDAVGQTSVDTAAQLDAAQQAAIAKEFLRGNDVAQKAINEAADRMAENPGKFSVAAAAREIAKQAEANAPTITPKQKARAERDAAQAELAKTWAQTNTYVDPWSYLSLLKSLEKGINYGVKSAAEFVKRAIEEHGPGIEPAAKLVWKKFAKDLRAKAVRKNPALRELAPQPMPGEAIVQPLRYKIGEGGKVFTERVKRGAVVAASQAATRDLADTVSMDNLGGIQDESFRPRKVTPEDVAKAFKDSADIDAFSGAIDIAVKEGSMPPLPTLAQMERMQTRQIEIINELTPLQDKALSARKRANAETDPVKKARLEVEAQKAEARARNKEDQLDVSTRALLTTASEAGRRLAFQNRARALDGTPAGLYSQGQRLKGSSRLTPKEMERLIKIGEALEASRAEMVKRGITETEPKPKPTTAPKPADATPATPKEPTPKPTEPSSNPRPTVVDPKAVIRERMVQRVRDLKQAVADAKKKTPAMFMGPGQRFSDIVEAAAPIVKELVKDAYELGKTTLKEVVADVKKVLADEGIDITDQEVIDSWAGRYDGSREPKTTAPSPFQELTKEARKQATPKPRVSRRAKPPTASKAPKTPKQPKAPAAPKEATPKSPQAKSDPKYGPKKPPKEGPQPPRPPRIPKTRMSQVKSQVWNWYRSQSRRGLLTPEQQARAAKLLKDVDGLPSAEGERQLDLLKKQIANERKAAMPPKTPKPEPTVREKLLSRMSNWMKKRAKEGKVSKDIDAFNKAAKPFAQMTDTELRQHHNVLRVIAENEKAAVEAQGRYDAKSPLGKATSQVFSAIFGTRQALQTSMDIGHITRQGGPALLVNPVQWFETMKKSGFTASDSSVMKTMANIMKEAEYPASIEAGISYPAMNQRRSGPLVGDKVQNLPGIRQSGNLLDGFLSELRFNVYKRFAERVKIKSDVLDPRVNKLIGDHVNQTTGHGTGQSVLSNGSDRGIWYAGKYLESKWQTAFAKSLRDTIKLKNEARAAKNTVLEGQARRLERVLQGELVKRIVFRRMYQYMVKGALVAAGWKLTEDAREGRMRYLNAVKTTPDGKTVSMKLFGDQEEPEAVIAQILGGTKTQDGKTYGGFGGLIGGDAKNFGRNAGNVSWSYLTGKLSPAASTGIAAGTGESYGETVDLGGDTAGALGWFFKTSLPLIVQGAMEIEGSQLTPAEKTAGIGLSMIGRDVNVKKPRPEQAKKKKKLKIRKM